MSACVGWRRPSKAASADRRLPPVPAEGRLTRRLAVWLAVFVVGTGTVGVAQAVVSPEELVRAMKTIGTAVEGVNQAIASKSYVDAKTPLALSRQVLASTRPWWTTSQKPDAAAMTKEAVAKLDALDKVLSAKAVDAAAVATALQDVTRSCAACHAKYREGDPQTGYRIKSVSR